jgi:UDP-N-acetylmuramyl pentapeptide phosphotransferase/UDP-N-acetylglucosamine-1-phosphate transferase
MQMTAVATASALLCALLILALKPLLVRYALARPNARSSHTSPTPQGGGIAVMGATLIAAGGALALSAALADGLGVVAASCLVLALVGAIDDIRPLPAGPRLVLHCLAVAALVFSIDARILPEPVPLWLERMVLILSGVWFVNLVNFMDGLDWITTAEMVPITAFLAGLGVAGLLPEPAALVAAALCGAMLGFAPFNKPVARLFLGDVGSLPIGLLVGWLLLQLAASGALAAAILLPLYPVADATLTLLRRLARGERVWEAHRTHFYQKATDNGFSALEVSGQVFALNLVLAALAAATIAWPSGAVQVLAVLAGMALVGMMLGRFVRPRRAGAIRDRAEAGS